MRRVDWEPKLVELDKLCTKFCVNRHYREKSFKDEAEYAEAQREVGAEIDKVSKEIEWILREGLAEGFPEVEMLLFDPLPFSAESMQAGAILVKGIKSMSETFDVADFFWKALGVHVRVDRVEDLPEDVAKRCLSLTGK